MPTLDFTSMVVNLAQLAMVGGPLWLLVSAICWLMAFVFGITAAMQLKAYGEDSRSGIKPALFSFLAGVFMASSPTLLQSILVTFYGNSQWGTSPLSYVVDQSSSSPFKAVLTVVSFMGYCFFVRGIWTVKEMGEPQRYPQSTTAKAGAYLVAGMCSIYIDTTLKMISSLTGWNISYYIN